MLTNNEIELISNGDSNAPFRILQSDNEEDLKFLRTKCIDIVNVENIKDDQEIQLFITRLKTTLKLKGVGIAAPQVGLGRNIMLFMRIDKPERPIQVAINPRIVDKSTNIVSFERDGCLSVPDKSASTDRYEWIQVEYYDENGIVINERLSGVSRLTDFTGVIFQHEFDHLNGILFIDRLTK